MKQMTRPQWFLILVVCLLTMVDLAGFLLTVLGLLSDLRTPLATVNLLLATCGLAALFYQQWHYERQLDDAKRHQFNQSRYLLIGWLSFVIVFGIGLIIRVERLQLLVGSSVLWAGLLIVSTRKLYRFFHYEGASIHWYLFLYGVGVVVFVGGVAMLGRLITLYG